MIDQPSSIQEVLSNPELLSAIFTFLRYDYLQGVRLVCKSWQFMATKLLRPITRVCINEKNLDTMLCSRSLLGLTLHIRWSPYISLGLKTLIQKYSRYIKSLSWFMDESGTLRVASQPNKVVHWDINGVQFPELKDIYIIVSNIGTTQTETDNLMISILSKSKQLESLRIDVFDKEFGISNIIVTIHRLKPTKLTSLHLGKGVRLTGGDLELIQRFETQIVSFVWENYTKSNFSTDNRLKPNWLNSLIELRMCASQTLQLPNTILRIRKLSLTNLDCMVPLNAQFPELEELNMTLKPGFKWENWIPIKMRPHFKIKSLKWLNRSSFDDYAQACFTRMFTKFPNLVSLSCPASDNFLCVICTNLKQLKFLELNGGCTDFGITGISSENIRYISSNRQLAIFTKDEKNLIPFRQQSSLVQLKYLEELTVVHTQITDNSVNFCLKLMSNLRKVYLTGVSLTAIHQLLNLPKISVIGVPQPLEGKISYDEIVNLQETTSNVRVIVGWDWAEFQFQSKTTRQF